MWAGVQKVFRPMERCQEISQWPPMTAEATARTEHQMYQAIKGFSKPVLYATNRVSALPAGPVPNAAHPLRVSSAPALLEEPRSHLGGKRSKCGAGDDLQISAGLQAVHHHERAIVAPDFGDAERCEDGKPIER